MISLTISTDNTILADDTAIRWLRDWSWFVNSGYAARNRRNDDGAGPSKIYLHNELFPPPDGLMVDHINRDRLDNRSQNIRWVTQAENKQNQRRKKSASSTSQFVGVYWSVSNNHWVARLRRVYLGQFVTEEEAAIAYDTAADRLGWLGPRNFTEGAASGNN